MIIIAGKLKVAPGFSREAAVAQFKGGIEATRAEPGCIEYSFSFDMLDETIIHIFEIYKDADAVAAHRANLAARRRAAPAGGAAPKPAVQVVERALSEYDISAERKL